MENIKLVAEESRKKSKTLIVAAESEKSEKSKNSYPKQFILIFEVMFLFK